MENLVSRRLRATAKWLRSIERRWAIFGFFFGFTFPVVASILEMRLQELTFTLKNLLVTHNSNPLLWIVDTAPFVLGFVFSLVDRQELKLKQTNKDLDITIQELQKLQSNLEKIVEERTSQLKAINEVGRVATSTLDPDDLINRVVNLLTEEFGYYYSAVYLTDHTNTWAELKDATGEAGRVLKESEHRLEVDSSNIVGQSIRNRHAQIALDVGDKAVRFNYPLLPYTRSEIAIPLYVGDRILGALDVHSSQEFAFSEQDIETLQNMANQIAISLDNARLFQTTSQNLQEMHHIQKQYLRESWVDTSLPSGEISLAIGEGGQSNKKNSVEVPIALRDQVIGQLSLERDEALSPDEQNWIQAIATQTALALENARLLDESQSAAMREKFVTEITNKIWSSTTTDGVLQTAVQELSKILDATEATIELDFEEN